MRTARIAAPHAFLSPSSNLKEGMVQVHLLDAADAHSRPRLVEARTPGLSYFVEHHGNELLLLVHVANSSDYELMHAPVLHPQRW